MRFYNKHKSSTVIPYGGWLKFTSCAENTLNVISYAMYAHAKMSCFFFSVTLTHILALGACPLNTPILRPRLDFSRPSVYADGYRMRDWWFLWLLPSRRRSHLCYRSEWLMLTIQYWTSPDFDPMSFMVYSGVCSWFEIRTKDYWARHTLKKRRIPLK